MDTETIKKASEIITSKTAKENMGAGVTISLIDEEGYPTTSSLSIATANGIEELYFGISLSSNKAIRAIACPRASVNLFDDNLETGSYYNITLVGDVEIITDSKIKQANWYEGLAEHFDQGVNDSDYVVLKFTTKRYKLWLDFSEEVVGQLTKN